MNITRPKENTMTGQERGLGASKQRKWVFKIFGYYINIFKAKPSHTVGNESFQVRQSGGRYLILCDNDGYRVSNQTKMLLTNNVNEPSTCTIELFCDLNHIDEEPILKPRTIPIGSLRASGKDLKL